VCHVEVDESRNSNRRVESGMAVTYLKIVKYRHNDRIQSANNNIQPVSNNLKLDGSVYYEIQHVDSTF